MSDKSSQETAGGWPPPTPGPTPEARTAGVVIAVAALTVVALIAAASGWLAWRDARSDADNAREQLAEQRREPRDTVTTAPDSTDDPSAILDGLLGGDVGDLGGLLGGDLGGASQCMGGGDLGDLGGLLGGGADPIPKSDARTQYAEIAKRVEAERGLTFEHVPEPTFVDADEMSTRVEARIRADYPADLVRADQDLYRAIGAIEPDTDLLDEYAEFIGGQVAGYYDPESGELVVLGDDKEPFGAIEMSTIAHELEHALADQVLGFPIADEPDPEDEDGQRAALALVEGDAVLTQTRFQLAAVDFTELLGSLGSAELGAAQQALADAPPFLADQLMFSYTEGLAFVCGIEAEGGWKAVDAAYDAAPTTTAQILFPDRYLAGESAVGTPEPNAPGDDWEHVRTTTFGAADLLFLFEDAELNEPRDRAAAWAGGTVGQWRRGDDVAVRIELVQRDDHDDLCDSMKDWVATLDDAHAQCAADRITVAIGG